MFLFLYFFLFKTVYYLCFFFFFQAEDGIRDLYVTGVQTCALPIFYDGALSHDVAFGPLVRDPAAWIERLTARKGANGGSADVPEVLAIATDGETFGHHHREGAVTLARVLDALSKRADVRVDNFAAFLARHPPQEDVRLVAPSAWSCPHGVERWRSDCGCRVHGDRATHQRWRAPLRNALDWLAAE